jgi:hypothetical protein
MIQFLGLGIRFQKNAERPSLVEKTDYFSFEKEDGTYTDEVKIVNLGGDFQKLSALTDEQKVTLAEFLHGASKATAHLTEGSGHKLNENHCTVFICGCDLIIRLVTDALSRLRPAAGVPTADGRP